MLSSVFFDLAIDGVLNVRQFRGEFLQNRQTTLNLFMIDTLTFFRGAVHMLQHVLHLKSDAVDQAILIFFKRMHNCFIGPIMVSYKVLSLIIGCEGASSELFTENW